MAERVKHDSIAAGCQFEILTTDKDKIVQKGCFGLIKPIKVNSSVAVVIEAGNEQIVAAIKLLHFNMRAGRGILSYFEGLDIRDVITVAHLVTN